MVPFRPAAAALLAAALLAPASAARADLVRTFDGKWVEGKVSRSGNKVTVKGYKGKSTTFAASELKGEPEPGECSWDAAARMAKEIPPDASDVLYVEKRLQIARYLKERREYTPEMAELEAKEYELILKRDANNAEAHAGLNHVKWGQWWFKSEKDRDAKKKNAPASEMEPLGYVKVKKTGLWELKEDAEAIEAGKVKYKGKWMTEDEKKEAQGYLKDEKGNWVLARDVKDRERSQQIEKDLGEKPVAVQSSRHFRMISWLPVGETAQLKELAEKTYEKHRELLGYPLAKEEEAEDELFGEPIEVFVLRDPKLKDKWINAYGKGLGWSDAIVQNRLEPGTAGFHSAAPPPYLLMTGREAEKNRERDHEQDFLQAKSRVASMTARILLDRIRQQQPAWLAEANAFLGEIRMNETAECCYVSMTKYREAIADKNGSRAKYYEYMRKQIDAGLDRSMRSIFSMELNKLDWADNVKAWSFLEFLLANYRTEFQQLIRVPMADVEEITPAQIQAAIDGTKSKDPADIPAKGKEQEGAVPKENVKVRGPGAQAVTEGSKEERAMHAASAEQWLGTSLKKDLDALEKEWKAWVRTK
jgi:hypothetical protein